MAHISEKQLQEAEDRMSAGLSNGPHAVEAHYDRETSKLMITLSSGVELLIPSHLAEGICDAHPDDLEDIELSPTGLGLHFPRLDADLYVPGLLAGALGSRSFMAAQAAKGASAKPPAKAVAARPRLGGRPPLVRPAGYTVGIVSKEGLIHSEWEALEGLQQSIHARVGELLKDVVITERYTGPPKTLDALRDAVHRLNMGSERFDKLGLERPYTRLVSDADLNLDRPEVHFFYVGSKEKPSWWDGEDGQDVRVDKDLKLKSE